MAGPPFNIDNTNPTVSSLVSAYPPNEQANRATIEAWLTFLSDPTTGIIKNAALPADIPTIPSGTRMLFQQTAAPTGWTKDTTQNNKALRIVSGTVGSGGSVDFTAAFASKAVAGTISSTTATGTVGNTTLSITQIPSHTHGPGTLSGTTSYVGDHTHTYTAFASQGNADGGGSIVGAWAGTQQYSTTPAGAHSHTVTISSGVTGSAGSGGSHTHTFTGTAHSHTFTGTAINLAVKYVDVIIAERD